VSKVWHPAWHIIGHFGDGPPGNHLHWYGKQKLTAKSMKPKWYKKKPKIQDPSLMLSEIMPNFGRFLPSQILRVWGPKSCTQIVMSASWHVTWNSFVKFPSNPQSYKCTNAEFLYFHYWGTPVPGGCGLASLGHFLAHVKISVKSTLQRPRCSLPKKLDLGWVNMCTYNFFLSGPKFTEFFVAGHVRNYGWSLAFPIFDISLRSRDICDRSLK